MASKRDIQGRVQGVNANGVNIDGAWLNYSKFFKGERNPAKGASVTAVIGEFNGRDYLNELTVIGTALPQSFQNGPVSTYSGNGRSVETDRRIARQVALKAAVDFAEYRHTDAETSDVISYARMFEAYLAEPYNDASAEDAA